MEQDSDSTARIASAPVDKKILLGKIVGLFGVDGWIKLESYTEPRLSIFKYRPWLMKHASTVDESAAVESEVELSGAKGRAQGKGVVAVLPGVNTRDAAAAWIGAEIWVRRSSLPKSKQNDLYWIDLEGLDVVSVEGVGFGKVSHLFSTGANDVLVVLDKTRERMIPFVRDQFVREVDLVAGRIVVDWDPEF